MRFTLSKEPLHVEDFSRGLHAAGAVVIFEGRVRARNEGRAVSSLEYSAYEELAGKEGERVLAEALTRFPILDCRALHRTGHLQLGELAVWVGVAAGHRGEAFEACRWIIDELKARVPIWKKEHYADGGPVWLEGSHQAGASENGH